MDKNIGKPYGYYTIIGIDSTRCADKHIKYIAQCSCGKITKTSLSNIKSIQSHYKCPHVWYIGDASFTRPLFKSKALIKVYYAMLQRCYNSKNKDFKNYGAKGIVVCDEWLNNPVSFEAWSYQNGYTDSKKLSIDRIYESKGYTPSNCRWITIEENARFKSTTNYITATVTLSGKQWASLIPSIGCNYINTLARTKGKEEAVKFIEKMLCDKHKGTSP